ncbi:MAG: hypothetical protein A2Y78_10135 [Acidobacteria bacterium RBG_13_68_16]|nr:MAG: hypothetical protein A2Y78_10135 [Acidobacteria bacterium RBG_13_68_16]
MYTGAWAAQRRYQPVPHAVRTVDPVHEQEVYTDPRDNHEAPPGPDYGNPGEMPWLEWIVQTDGEPWDELPLSHEFEASHADDLGQRLNRIPVGIRHHDDVPQSVMFEGIGSMPPPYGEVRGMNSRPENQPEGYRLGLYLGRTWSDRKRWVGERRTDRRVTTQPSITIPDVTVDTVPDAPGYYSSPFSVWARPLNGSPMRPSQRRTPTGLDEGELADGTEEYTDAGVDSSWMV